MISQIIIFSAILTVIVAGVQRADTVLEKWDYLTRNERRIHSFENSVSEEEEEPIKNKFRCPFLNPWLDAVAHPASDPGCGHGEPGWQARPTCRCRYIVKDRDENGCTIKFFTLCTSSIFDLEDSSGENPVSESSSKSESNERDETQVSDKSIHASQLEDIDASNPFQEFGNRKL